MKIEVTKEELAMLAIHCHKCGGSSYNCPIEALGQCGNIVQICEITEGEDG